MEQVHLTTNAVSPGQPREAKSRNADQQSKPYLRNQVRATGAASSTHVCAHDALHAYHWALVLKAPWNVRAGGKEKAGGCGSGQQDLLQEVG